MEPVSILGCLARPLFSVLGKLKKVDCGSVNAVVLPRCAGKSTFINSVSSKDYLLLDIEENLKLELSEAERSKLQSLVGNSSYNLHYFPLARDYLKKIRENHKHKRLVIFCSDLELVKYLGIKNVFTYVPSNGLSERIKMGLEEEQRAVYEQSRMELLIHAKDKALTAYNDFTALAQMISAQFKLAQKL